MINYFRDMHRPIQHPDGSRNTKKILCHYVTDEANFEIKNAPNIKWYEKSLFGSKRK
jgi:hypothetical protein